MESKKDDELQSSNQNERASIAMISDDVEINRIPVNQDEEKFYKEFLEWHNHYRKLHNVPSLNLNQKLMEFAKNRAKHLARNNLYQNDIIQYGESVHIIRGSVAFSAEQIAKFWYNQKMYYDFEAAKPNNKSALAFTQMVWKSTRQLGVATAKESNVTWLVAIYEPPGNFFDKFSSNVPLGEGLNEDTKEHSNLNDAFQIECLEAHNSYRNQHGCPALKLNRKLCDAANEWAMNLAKHKKLITPEERRYGLNMFQGESIFQITAEQVVKLWYDEVKKYDFDGKKLNVPKTEHFTQLIWRNTTDLGVGYIRDGKITYVVCYYLPSGNYPGEFNDNVPKRGSQPSTADAVDASDETELESSILFAHNKYRQMHGSPPLLLSKKLSKFATEWAENLARRNAMEHHPKNTYGENIYLAQGVPDVTGERVVKAWYNEISEYDFDAPQFSSETSHFTQLIWATTKELGIGIAKKNNSTWVVCNYDPPGNFQGQFKENIFEVGSPLYVDPNTYSEFTQQCLSAHNRYRALHGCPPLELSYRLNQFASEWAKTLAKSKQLQRRPSNIFGENIFMGSHWSMITGEYVVTSWYDEISNYDFEDPKFSKETRHFTQLIWKNSTELGVKFIKNEDTTIVVAYYSPAGNIGGDFEENVPRRMIA